MNGKQRHYVRTCSPCLPYESFVFDLQRDLCSTVTKWFSTFLSRAWSQEGDNDARVTGALSKFREHVA